MIAIADDEAGVTVFRAFLMTARHRGNPRRTMLVDGPGIRDARPSGKRLDPILARRVPCNVLSVSRGPMCVWAVH